MTEENEIRSTRRRYLFGIGAAAVGSTVGVDPSFGSGRQAGSESWPQFGFDASNTGYAPNNRAPVLSVEQRWRFKDQKDGGSSPVIAGDTAYVALGDDMYGINMADGTKLEGSKWPFKSRNTITSTPAVADGELYFANRNSVRALDGTTGDALWSVGTSDRVKSSPTVVGELLFIGSTSGYLYAIDRTTGNVEWSKRTDFLAEITAAPAVSGQTVYVADQRGTVYARSITDGTKRWTFKCNEPVTEPPTVSNGVVYVSDTAGRVHAIDAETESRRWMYDTGSSDPSSAAITEETLYVGCADGNLYAVDIADGTERWAFETGGQVYAPAIVERMAYIGSGDGKVYAVDVSDGTEQWSFDTGGPVESAPAVSDGIVCVRSSNRGLFALQVSLEADFSYQPEQPVTGETMTFDASSSSPSSLITSYEWSIDGQTFTGKTVQYSFDKIGNQDISLTVEDSFGHTDTKTITIPISGQAPTANISYEPSDPEPGEPITFTAQASTDPDGSIRDYQWLIGTNSYSTKTVRRTFQSAGSYYVELKVVDDDGLTDTAKTTISVSTPTETPTLTPPTETDTPTPTSTPTPTTATETTTSTATPAAPDDGSDGGSGGDDAGIEWARLGIGAVGGSLLGFAAGIYYSQLGDDEGTEPPVPTSPAADGSGVVAHEAESSTTGDPSASEAGATADADETSEDTNDGVDDSEGEAVDEQTDATDDSSDDSSGDDGTDETSASQAEDVEETTEADTTADADAESERVDVTVTKEPQFEYPKSGAGDAETESDSTQDEAATGGDESAPADTTDDAAEADDAASDAGGDDEERAAASAGEKSTGDETEDETEAADGSEDDFETLTDIDGIGDAKAESLREAGFETVDEVRLASESALSEVTGIGDALAAQIKAVVGDLDASEVADGDTTDESQG